MCLNLLFGIIQIKEEKNKEELNHNNSNKNEPKQIEKQKENENENENQNKTEEIKEIDWDKFFSKFRYFKFNDTCFMHLFFSVLFLINHL
jgi:hypothetical protein